MHEPAQHGGDMERGGCTDPGMADWARWTNATYFWEKFWAKWTNATFLGKVLGKDLGRWTNTTYFGQVTKDLGKVNQCNIFLGNVLGKDLCRWTNGTYLGSFLGNILGNVTFFGQGFRQVLRTWTNATYFGHVFISSTKCSCFWPREMWNCV